MSAEHRAKFGLVYRLNPHNFFKSGSDSYDPCAGIKYTAKHGGSVRAVAMELATIVWSETPDKTDTWAIAGARQFFCGFACEAAANRPDDCTLTDAYLFGERGSDEIVTDLEAMADSSAGGDVAGFARKFISMIKTAPKQWEAIRDAYSQALAAYAPGERYAMVTAPGGLDVAKIKGTVATIYLMGDGSSALVDGPWMAATINTMVDSFYRAPGQGKVLVWIEELLTLPRLYAIERALNLYRSGGIQVVVMIQSRGALIAKYGKESAYNFELQAGFVRYWTIEEADLLRDLEFISGKTSVVVRHFSAQDSAFQQAGFGLGEVVRPLFTSDELRLLGATKQLLRVPNCPLLVVDLVPWTAVEQYATALRDPRTLTRETVITLPRPSTTTPGGSS
jgi:type IV secretory pathway TraG/TraD family ATPase VirD4